MLPAADMDEGLYQALLWNCDVLQYLKLIDAMKCGDIRRMEDLLPHLLFCLVGGGNHKYVTEILELLQSLQHEWTPELRCKGLPAKSL